MIKIADNAYAGHIGLTTHAVYKGHPGHSSYNFSCHWIFNE
jgi:hypothetical protein